MEPLPQRERRFVQVGLPWMIAASGLLGYLATLNRWLAFGNLTLAANIGGWRWQPMLQDPVLMLLTWPLRWLPEAWVPLALNVFAAVCASLTLALLARSVALLPQQGLTQPPSAEGEPAVLSGPGAWVPPVLAVVALGLQLTFWEHATVGSGEMLQLLLFAGVFWCVLEHRYDQRPAWLDRAAFLCGLALANSWAMAGFLPLVAVAVIWSKRFRFFNMRTVQRLDTSTWGDTLPGLAEDGRFFLRMFLFWLAGLAFILLSPLAGSLSSDSHLTFWKVLGDIAEGYGTVLLLMAKVFRHNRELGLLLFAVPLVPLFLLTIRWHLSSSGGAGGHNLDPVAVIIYAAHAFLLVLCASVAFDPPFSPGQLSRKLAVNLPFLPLYYLVSLSLGYYAGFFLVASRGDADRRQRFLRALRWATPKLVYCLLGLTLAVLLWKNLPSIRVANGTQLAQYARLMLDSLPPKPAVVCGYDAGRLALLRGALGREGKAPDYVVVDGAALTSESYRAWLKKKFPKLWTDPPSKLPGTPAEPAGAQDSLLNAAVLLRLLDRLVQSNHVCFLERRYGLLAEEFQFQPHNLLYDLKLYPTNDFGGAPLTGAEFADNEAFWKRLVQTAADPITALVREADQGPSDPMGLLMQRAHVRRQLPEAITRLAHWYSGALNAWGVELQRHNQWQATGACFTQALQLNPNNQPAQVNFQYNANRLAGKEAVLLPAESMDEQLERARNVAALQTSDGPFDDPSWCYRLGMECLKQREVRQAGQLCERARALAPNEIKPRLVLASLRNSVRQPDRARELVADIQANHGSAPLDPKVRADLAFIEAATWLLKTNSAKALAILQPMLDAEPVDSLIYDRAKTLFMQFGDLKTALRVADQEVRLTPNSLGALMDNGILHLQLR